MESVSCPAASSKRAAIEIALRYDTYDAYIHKRLELLVNSKIVNLRLYVLFVNLREVRSRPRHLFPKWG